MRIEMYQDKAGEWRWRLVAPNGRILCDSAEGYSTKPGVRRSIANFVKYLSVDVPVEEKRAAVAQDVSPKVRVSRPKAAARKRG